MKSKINIRDRNFSHVKYSSDFQESEHIEWNRDFDDDSDEICFITDDYLSLDLQKNNFIAWLLEPRGTNYSMYNYIKNNHNKFKYVLTYDKECLDIDEKFLFYPHGGCWIKNEEAKIYEKTKLVSMISSTKNFGAPGHSYRKIIRETFPDMFDSFGRGHNEINFKLEGLKDYMFSITVENSKFDYYFSEKLIDCFQTGTIPIYWGCPSIKDFFDIEGILTFETIEDLKEILKNLSSELYHSKIKSVQNNFELSKKYILSEDWIYNNTKIFKTN